MTDENSLCLQETICFLGAADGLHKESSWVWLKEKGER